MGDEEGESYNVAKGAYMYNGRKEEGECSVVSSCVAAGVRDLGHIQTILWYISKMFSKRAGMPKCTICQTILWLDAV